MSLELKESRQAGDPTGLESNDAALADKSTGISAAGPGLTQPERLDPSRAPSDLVPRARALHLEATATMNRAWRDALEAAQDHAASPLPRAMLHSDALTAEAVEQVDLAVAVGERTGYLNAFEDVARDLFPLVWAAGYREGQKDLVVGQDAAHRRWQEEMDRQLVASLSKGVPYPELCELRGEHDRAVRARQVLAERGVVA